MTENHSTNEKNTCGLTFEEKLRTFEQKLEKHLKEIDIAPHFLPQKSNREPYILYPHSETPMHLGGSTRIPNATCMKRRGRF